MPADLLNYREAFIGIINNRDKAREKGFIVFLHGSEDLAPMEEVCFASEQTFNHCFTARYGGGRGDVITPLIQQFVLDARRYLNEGIRINPSKSVAGRDINQSAYVQSLVEGLDVLGQFRPKPEQNEWMSILPRLQSVEPEPDRFNLDKFFSVVQSVLKTGQRLILFCELADLGPDCTLPDIGLNEAALDHLHERLPERMGLVFSGLPASIEIEGWGSRFLNLTAGSDYGGATGTAPERSQPLKNDSPLGEDRLSIASEVNALTDAIAGRDMDPPLVVGILGGWGAGKSFILHLLQERLRFIRNQDLSDERVRRENPYVGHPYLVRFDAWTYAKADLWASLMERILFDLDQQLNLEQAVAPLGILEKGFDLWEIIAHSSPERLKALKEELGEEAVRRISDWKQGAGTASALWEALKGLRAEELENLRMAKEELEQKQKENTDALLTMKIETDRKFLEQRQKFDRELADKQQGQKNLLAQKQAELESTRRRVKDEITEEMEGKARTSAWNPVFGEIRNFFGVFADWALRESGMESGNAPVSIWMVEKQLGLLVKYLAGLFRSPASLAFLVIAILTALAVPFLEKVQIDSMWPMLGTVGAALGSLYTALTKVNAWFESEQGRYEAQMASVNAGLAGWRQQREQEKQQEEIVPLETELEGIRTTHAEEIIAFEETRREQLKNQQVEAEKQLADQQKSAQAEIQELETKVAEHERRAGIPGQSRSLMDLIQKRIESGFYQERLGILHQVQKDLYEITEALIPVEGHDSKLFPRGAPRIIILIDDLDRCPPDKVVQVLEAAQLLVKTRLFVVVLAMDVRYVTRALEKEYREILVHEGNPSGLDYAEKIIQIPYRVRPIAPEAMGTYLRSLMVVREPAMEHIPSGGPGAPPGSQSMARITNPGQVNSRVNETLPPEIQEFEHEELQLMEKAAGMAEISPRATKRLVNVMKLIKNIWYRRGTNLQRVEVKRAMVLILTLSARYPEAMARILDETERSFRDASRFDPNQSLRAALQAIIDKWSRLEGITEDWSGAGRLIAVDDLLEGHLHLGGLGLDNLQIVRSFSFLGEVEMPLVEKTQKQAIEWLGPELGIKTASPVKPSRSPRKKNTSTTK